MSFRPDLISVVHADHNYQVTTTPKSDPGIL